MTKKKPCDCDSMSCTPDCPRNHTHKRIFCELCQKFYNLTMGDLGNHVQEPEDVEAKGKIKAKVKIAELLNLVYSAKFGTKNRAELISRLQDISLIL